MPRKMKERIERDVLGAISVPGDALWGAQTQRALENFPISGVRFGRGFIAALGHVKRACALSNMELGQLDAERGGAIVRAADEMLAGKLDRHFPVDVFQTGSGTSTNMNANEVLARRASQLLADKLPIHPNDHVNRSQSSNDVFPTAIHVAAILALRDRLVPALQELQSVLEGKSRDFDAIIKTGRTHLQDATPIRLGQEFGGYAAQCALSVARARRAVAVLRELPLGGTAVGTGINCPAGFAAQAIAQLNRALETNFVEAGNHIEANATRDSLVEASGIIKTIAVSLHKVANDIRWLASGPRNGLGELRLPVVQPGSSIMPGKVNPVIPEALIMVCAQVIGYDAAITLGGLGGYFELNLMMPLIAHNVLHGLDLLSNAVGVFVERCVVGLTANAERCQVTLERNLALATALVPAIGYDQAAEIAKEAQRSGLSVRAVALARQALSASDLEAALDVYKMTTGPVE